MLIWIVWQVRDKLHKSFRVVISSRRLIVRQFLVGRIMRERMIVGYCR